MQEYVGMKLYGYCFGRFGSDSYGPKTIEGVSRDWIVVRESDGGARFAFFTKDEESVEEFIKENSVVPDEDDY